MTTYNGCPKDVLQFSFDDGSKMACAYRAGWQSGGDAQALALGCNVNASAPADFDQGAQTLEMYTCTDPSHCDFKKVWTLPRDGSTPPGAYQLDSVTGLSPWRPQLD